MRLISISTLFSIAALCAACSSSHDTATDGGSLPDSTVSDSGLIDADLVDSGLDAALIDGGHDAGSDAGHADAGGECNFASDHITVTSAPSVGATWSAEQCAAPIVGSEYVVATVRHIEAVSSANGIRIALDLCPSADDACLCEYTIANVGADILTRGDMLLEEGGSYVVQHATNSFVLSSEAVCECIGCSCAIAPVFFAVDARINDIPVQHEGLNFSLGEIACMTTDDPSNYTTRQPIRAESDGALISLEADEGISTSAEGSLNLRVVHSQQIECTACGGIGPSLRSWVFWKSLAIEPAL